MDHLECRRVLAAAWLPDVPEDVAERMDELIDVAGDAGASPWAVGRLAICWGIVGQEQDGQLPKLGVGGCCGAWVEAVAVDLAQCEAWRDDEFAIDAVCLYPERSLGGVRCHNAIRVIWQPLRSVYYSPVEFWLDNGFLGQGGDDGKDHVFQWADREVQNWVDRIFTNLHRHEINQQIARLSK